MLLKKNIEIVKDVLPLMLFDYATDLFFGRNGYEQNKDKAIDLMIESARLGNVAALIQAPLFQFEHAKILFDRAKTNNNYKYEKIKDMLDAHDLITKILQTDWLKEEKYKNIISFLDDKGKLIRTNLISDCNYCANNYHLLIIKDEMSKDDITNNVFVRHKLYKLTNDSEVYYKEFIISIIQYTVFSEDKELNINYEIIELLPELDGAIKNKEISEDINKAMTKPIDLKYLKINLATRYICTELSKTIISPANEIIKKLENCHNIALNSLDKKDKNYDFFFETINKLKIRIEFLKQICKTVRPGLEISA